MNVAQQSLAAPQVATYKNIRIPLVGTLDQREGHTTTKDAMLVNFLTEKVKDPITDNEKYYLLKRPGTMDLNTVVGAGTVPSSPSGEGRGIYLWNSNIYSVFGNTLYRNASSIKTLATSTGKCGFVLATAVS